MPANLENSALATELEKFSFIPVPKKGNAEECSNYWTIALISHASKVMLKILQARLQQYTNRELPDVQAGFRKGRGARDQIANICWIIEKAREFQVGKQQLELDMEQQTFCKYEKEYIKAVYCHHDYLTYMQSIYWETLGWLKHKPGEISITSEMQMTPPLGQKVMKK